MDNPAKSGTLRRHPEVRGSVSRFKAPVLEGAVSGSDDPRNTGLPGVAMMTVRLTQPGGNQKLSKCERDREER